MKFGTVLIVSLLMLGTSACSSKWPPQVRQEALEMCTMAVAATVQIWPPNPQVQLEKATKICACAVGKAESANSKPPHSMMEFDRMVSPHLSTCRNGS